MDSDTNVIVLELPASIFKVNDPPSIAYDTPSTVAKTESADSDATTVKTSFCTASEIVNE